MNISALGRGLELALSLRGARAGARVEHTGSQRRGVRPAVSSQTAPTPSDEVGSADETTNQTGARGVIRLLQAGHFKGVADVRLRINFHDQLTAAQLETLRPLVEERAAAAAEAVDDILEAFADSGELTEEQAASIEEARNAFDAAVDDAWEKSADSSDLTGAELIADMESAFASLLESLQSILSDGASSEEAGVGEGAQGLNDPALDALDGAGETPVDGPTDPADDVETVSLLDTLTGELEEAFGAALDELTTTFASATGLPELTPPNGNGRAYEKFLAIYNDMLAGGLAQETALEEPAGILA